MKRILVVFGVDRETTRIAPVVAALRERPECVVGVCVATRGEAALKPLFDAFGIDVDYGPDPACPEPAIARPSSALLDFLGDICRKFSPDVVLVGGTGVAGVAAALVAHRRRIPVAQVAAGLRSADRSAQWSVAEMNSRVVEALASWLFVPTPAARDTLVGEGVAPEGVVLTGHTEMDALVPVVERLQGDLSLRLRMSVAFPFLDARRPLILAFREPRAGGEDRLQDFCRALRMAARLHPEAQIVLPVDPDPGYRGTVEAILRDVAGVHRIQPLDFIARVYLMTRSHFVVSDTEELAWETSALGKRLLVACDTAVPAEAAVGEEVIHASSDPDFLAAAMHRLFEELLKRGRKVSEPDIAQQTDTTASRRVVQALLGSGGGEAGSRSAPQERFGLPATPGRR